MSQSFFWAEKNQNAYSYQVLYNNIILLHIYTYIVNIEINTYDRICSELYYYSNDVTHTLDPLGF